MKILLYSPAFAPSVGGLETVVAILAEEFVKLGCEVAVVTTTRAGGAPLLDPPRLTQIGSAGGGGPLSRSPRDEGFLPPPAVDAADDEGFRPPLAVGAADGENVLPPPAEPISTRRGGSGWGAPPAPQPPPYTIVRCPTPRELLRWTRWCDVYFQANVSLRGLWPLLLIRRPWAVSHHSWYCRTDGRIVWADRLKRFLTRRAALSVAVSRAMADDLGANTIVIGNPYREDLFHPHPQIPRERDLVAVGRLVSDKGFDLLLDALATLVRDRDVAPTLTVIGEGPERAALEAQATRLGLAEQVVFTGGLPSTEISRCLAAHRVLVVPSRYREPFGLVALEGIACGCAIVASSGGGLPEAVGSCGVTFPNGDVLALAAAITELLESAPRRAALLESAAEHLAQHTRARVARRYLDALQGALST